MTELALDTDLDEEQREYLNTAKASAESLLDVINDILDFSKIEARKLDLECIQFSVKDVINALTKVLRVRAAERGLNLRSNFASDLPAEILGDPGRLRQVLVNLVGNAIKFTEKGEIVVGVEKVAETAGEVTLHFAVKDTGIGIPEEKQRLIFDAFVQADASSTRQFGGTGLGLAITSKLVDMMGGKVWVESEVARGSTFHFSVCMGVAPVSAAGPEQAPILARRLPAQGRQDLRVLVVEDNPVNQLLAVRLIEKQGHSVVAVGSGEEALESLHQERFDLVLMDVQMPRMD
jgi:signal transduction histidine kinase